MIDMGRRRRTFMNTHKCGRYMRPPLYFCPYSVEGVDDEGEDPEEPPEGIDWPEPAVIRRQKPPKFKVAEAEAEMDETVRQVVRAQAF